MTRTKKIISLLKKYYPGAKIALKYSNNWELLVAVILSAQCTDKRVNLVTKKLFQKYINISDYARANKQEFEKYIRSTGFYRNKAKNILATAKLILKNHHRKVPESMQDLLLLPGVARKTANIVLGNAYNIVEGIAVDTHVKRLSQRLGFSKEKNPDKIEKDLMKIIPQNDWFKLTYLLIKHGRAICEAKKPKCESCFLNKLCPSAFDFPQYRK